MARVFQAVLALVLLFWAAIGAAVVAGFLAASLIWAFMIGWEVIR